MCFEKFQSYFINENFVFGRDIKDENFSKLVLYRYRFIEKVENKAIQKY